MFSTLHGTYFPFYMYFKILSELCFNSDQSEILSSSNVVNHQLTLSHTMTSFDAPGKKPFENTVGKGEIASNEQFLLFPQCFLPIWITFCHFRQI